MYQYDDLAEPNEQHCYVNQFIVLQKGEELVLNTHSENIDIILIEFSKVNGSNSHIESIPQGIFHRYRNLETLIIDGVVSSLNAENFENASNLIDLRVNNKLTKIEGNVFDQAASLKFLDLSNNKIETIADSAFSGLALEVLRIRNNQLTIIHRNTFRDLNSLDLLDLTNNRIETIVKGAFNFPRLSILHLSCNRLRTLTDTLFRDTPQLRYIELSNGTGLTPIEHLFKRSKVLLLSGA